MRRQSSQRAHASPCSLRYVAAVAFQSSVASRSSRRRGGAGFGENVRQRVHIGCFQKADALLVALKPGAAICAAVNAESTLCPPT
jgi:hypothetical protein